MTAPLSEAAAKCREQFRLFLAEYTGMTTDRADADRVIEALGITWEQAAKLKSGAKIAEVVDLPQPPINMETSP